MAKQHEYKVGQSWVVVYPECLPGPTVGKIVVLTNEPGRYIGIEFEGPVTNGSDLNGRCKDKCGLWVHPAVHLLTVEEHAAMELSGQIGQIIPTFEEVSLITLDKSTNKLTPIP